jgi:hypothetical protein
MPTLQKDFSVPAVPIDLQSRLNLDGSTQADRNLAVEEADSGCFQIASRQIPGRKNRPKAGASNGRVRPSRQSTSPVMLPQHSIAVSVAGGSVLSMQEDEAWHQCALEPGDEGGEG